MELSFITNDTALARVAERAGVDRVFVDLERLGKASRQQGRALFQSTHVPGDVAAMRRILDRSELIVRIDPPNRRTAAQVEFAVRSGADYVMLPFFRTVAEAARFLEMVAGRAGAVLLVETAEAAEVLAELIALPGLSEVHIGLNDLSLSLGRRFLLDPIADGTVHGLCRILREAGMDFGFGGIGSLSRRDLPVNPEWVLACQVCEGATRGWLGRTFRETPPAVLPSEIERLRNRIAYWQSAGGAERREMESRLADQIEAYSRRCGVPATAPSASLPLVARAESPRGIGASEPRDARPDGRFEI